MTIDWQRVLPVLVSIGILIAVAILRQHSKTLAAIAATMPINIPLALWIVSSGEGSDRQAMVQFSETLMIGFPPTIIFLIVIWLAARAGLGVLPMILTGYAAWGVSLLITFWIRDLLTR